MSKYTPAVFQPTLRPSWAGAFEYIPTEELAKILKAITHFPNLEVEDSVFWNQTIKPDLEQQYQSFNETCEKRGRGARTYWGEHKLSLTITQDKLCKDKDKDKDKDENKDNKGGVGGKEKEGFVPPTLEEVLEYAREQNNFAGCGGFACTPEQAEEFWSYYESQGWRIGNDSNTPIRDWKPKLRQWHIKAKQVYMKQAMKTIKQPTVLNLTARERQDLINKEKTQALLKQLKAQGN